MNNETTHLLYNDLLQNVQFCKKPELPKITISKDNVNYHITDLTYLNQSAVAMIFELMNDAIANPNVTEIEYVIPDEMENENLKLITDIVTNIDFKAEKRGRDGWSIEGTFLTSGCCRKERKNGIKTITFYVNKDDSQAMKKYIEGKQTANFYDVVMAVADDTYKRFENIGAKL